MDERFVCAHRARKEANERSFRNDVDTPRAPENLGAFHHQRTKLFFRERDGRQNSVLMRQRMQTIVAAKWTIDSVPTQSLMCPTSAVPACSFTEPRGQNTWCRAGAHKKQSVGCLRYTCGVRTHSCKGGSFTRDYKRSRSALFARSVGACRAACSLRGEEILSIW